MGVTMTNTAVTTVTPVVVSASGVITVPTPGQYYRLPHGNYGLCLAVNSVTRLARFAGAVSAPDIIVPLGGFTAVRLEVSRRRTQ